MKSFFSIVISSLLFFAISLSIIFPDPVIAKKDDSTEEKILDKDSDSKKDDKGNDKKGIKKIAKDTINKIFKRKKKKKNLAYFM